MPAINGDAAARPLLLLHHRHRAHHTQPRRGGESWMPVVFGVCVVSRRGRGKPTASRCHGPLRTPIVRSVGLVGRRRAAHAAR